MQKSGCLKRRAGACATALLLSKQCFTTNAVSALEIQAKAGKKAGLIVAVQACKAREKVWQVQVKDASQANGHAIY
jgi:tRNA1(Val) A37 N6-methylase TrmN6